MCILFIYIANLAKQTTSVSPPIYKLIIASNRDLRHSISSTPAHFWNAPHSHILSGKDILRNRRDSGSWLGVSKFGQVGAVIRMMKEVLGLGSYEEYRWKRIEKTGTKIISRSVLVPQFLQSWSSNTSPSSDSDLKYPSGIPLKASGYEYCRRLCSHQEHRSQLKNIYPFHMFNIDLVTDSSSQDSIKATYLSNYNTPNINAKIRPEDLTPDLNSVEYFAYGNSPVYKPLSKVIEGKDEFIDILSEYGDEEGIIPANEKNKASICKQLLNFLRDTQKHLPDHVLVEYARACRIKEKIVYKNSSRFVTDYFDVGTRCQNIILVDSKNNVTFYDWYSPQPVGDPHTNQWEEKIHEFKINPP